MTKSKVILGIAEIVMLSICAIPIAAAQDNFSGVWVLDQGKTHDLPSGLKSYTMIVAQNEQQLVVETKLEGDLHLPGGSGLPGASGGGPGDMPSSHPIDAPPRSGGGGTQSGGASGGGFPAGPVAGGFPDIGPSNGAMALRMLIPRATYSLEGEGTTAQIEEPRPGTAKLKTKWSKDKKTLELSSVREADLRGHTVTVTSKERWKLSDGGEVLKVQRSLETPQGTDMISLIFRKGKVEPPTPQP